MRRGLSMALDGANMPRSSRIAVEAIAVRRVILGRDVRFPSLVQLAVHPRYIKSERIGTSLDFCAVSASRVQVSDQRRAHREP